MTLLVVGLSGGEDQNVSLVFVFASGFTVSNRSTGNRYVTIFSPMTYLVRLHSLDHPDIFFFGARYCMVSNCKSGQKRETFYTPLHLLVMQQHNLLLFFLK
jgi:hypothetical protein